jgi:Aromatic amino acid lyase
VLLRTRLSTKLAYTASARASVEVVSHFSSLQILLQQINYYLLADTRTDNHLALGNALLQHQHSGILPTSTSILSVLPLLDPMSSTSMPESWVRGAILIRMNSLIRGHSGVRWELIQKMGELLREDVIPVVPLRGSISASGGRCFSYHFWQYRILITV